MAGMSSGVQLSFELGARYCEIDTICVSARSADGGENKVGGEKVSGDGLCSR